jgi:hypothetical protein
LEKAERNVAASVLAAAATMVAGVGLAGLWHAAGQASLPTQQAGYPYTEFLTECVSVPFIVLVVVLTAALGWLFDRRVAIGVGAMLPFPIATSLEISRDSTTHNLLPFEAVIAWIPTFLVAFLGATFGMWVHRRYRATRQHHEA